MLKTQICVIRLAQFYCKNANLRHPSSNVLRLKYMELCNFSYSFVWKLKIHSSCERKNRTLTSENRVLRNISGSKLKEARSEQRKVRNEKLKNLYSSTNTIRVIGLGWKRLAEHVECMAEKRHACEFLVEKNE